MTDDGLGLPPFERMFDDVGMGPSQAFRRQQRITAWSPRQAIRNDTAARGPEHTFDRPVPIVARVVWAQDGEEHIETVALGWTGRHVYVRLTDRR
jgi:hypothetical protein